MIDEPLEHDATLRDALTDIAGDPRPAQPDWAELRGAINAHAASELAGAGGSAGVHGSSFLRALPPASHSSCWCHDCRTGRSRRRYTARGAAQVSIDDLLDANVTDGQFRALVSGASDADDLLSIAAGESQ